MKILALDPSTTNVGWCVAEDGRYLDSGNFKPEGKRAMDRLPAIFLFVLRKISQVKANVIAYEEPAGDHANRRTDRDLSRVSGLIIAAGVLTSVRKMVQVYPSQVKATKASKDNRAYAAAVAGKRRMGPDEADAIGVWLFAEGKLHRESLTSQAEASNVRNSPIRL